MRKYKVEHRAVINTAGGLMFRNDDLYISPIFERGDSGELARKQTRGEALTREEKNIVSLYAEKKRKENLMKK